MKKVSVFLSMALMLLVLAGCSDSKVDQLKKELRQADMQCPVNMGMMGDLIGLKYDDDARSAKMIMTIKDELVSFDQMKGVVGPTMVEQLKLAFTRDNMRPMIQLMVDAGSGLIIEMKDANSDDSFSVNLSVDDLRDVLNNEMSAGEVNENILAAQIESENAACPYDVDEGMTMLRVFDDGGNIIYVYSVDENLYDVSLLNSAGDDVKSEMAAMFSDPVIQRQIKMMVDMNKGMTYRYVGDRSQEEAEINFTPSELSAYVM